MCLAAGMNDYVSKPVNPGTLIRVLDRYIRGRGGVEMAAAPSGGTKTDISLAVFDAGQFLARVLGDREVAREILRLFLRSAAEQVARLRAGLDSGDARAVARELHALKGAAGTVGADAFRAKVLELETALQAGGIDAFAAGFASLEDELERLRGALEASELISWQP